MSSIKGDILFNGWAMLIRLLFGTALFIGVGRILGPSLFGDFMAAMAIGSMLAFLSNLGLTQQVLREVAVENSRIQHKMRELVAAKVTLSAVMLVFLLALALSCEGAIRLLAILTIAHVCDGMMDFLFALLKAKGYYKSEARFATVGSVLHFALVLTVCNYSPRLMELAWAYAFSRAVQLAAAIAMCGKHISFPDAGTWSASLRKQFANGWAYAVDVGVAQLASQLDTVIVRHLISAHAAGIYQAGMRVVVGINMLTVIAGNVFIPKLAASLKAPMLHRQVVSQFNRTFIYLTTITLVGVPLTGVAFTKLGYGAEFSELNALWPWLAVMATLRVVASKFGVRLTAIGRQYERSIVSIGAVFVSSLLMLIAIKNGAGLNGVIGALAATSALVLYSYKRLLQNADESKIEP